MRNPPKGTIYITTFNSVSIRKNAPFENFTSEKVKTDLEEAAAAVGFQNINEEPIIFEPANEKIEVKTIPKFKELQFKIKDFDGVSFSDSLKDAPPERQKLFKSWSKFWSHLSKIGYVIK